MNRNDPTIEEPRHIGRRSFLAGAIATTGVLGTGVAFGEPAHAQGSESDGYCEATACGTMTVWRLQSDWGYARGPHGKTKLESNASRQAAAHRWALTEQDALDMNLHMCSWAPAESFEVDACTFMEIWDHGGNGSYTWRNPWKDIDVQIFDTRCLEHIEDGDELWAKAFEPCDDSTTSGSATLYYETSFAGGGAAAPAQQAQAFVDNTATSDARELAFTGSNASSLAAAGMGLMALGGGVSLLAKRRAQVADDESADAES